MLTSAVTHEFVVHEDQWRAASSAYGQTFSLSKLSICRTIRRAVCSDDEGNPPHMNWFKTHLPKTVDSILLLVRRCVLVDPGADIRLHLGRPREVFAVVVEVVDFVHHRFDVAFTDVGGVFGEHGGALRDMCENHGEVGCDDDSDAGAHVVGADGVLLGPAHGLDFACLDHSYMVGALKHLEKRHLVEIVDWDLISNSLDHGNKSQLGKV